MITHCPVCRRKGKTHRLVPVRNGLRCGHPDNAWDGRAWSHCGFVAWGERPDHFARIDSPTTEQLAIREWFKLPKTRFALCNAGPGTAKTTTLSWSAEELFGRLGDLGRCYFTAFNRNARRVLLQKLPYEATEVYTLNGLAARFQGLRDYDEFKLRGLWSKLTRKMAEPPAFHDTEDLAERLRALCLFRPDPSDPWWTNAIKQVLEEFGMDRHEYELVPDLLTAAHARRETIDLSEQWSRAVTEAVARTRYQPPAARRHDWSDAEVRALADLVRHVELPNADPRFLGIDEAQDLSLAQLVLFMSAATKNDHCQVFLVGDDAHGKPSDCDYKAGQGVFAWRGGAGLMRLSGRLWTALTGEPVTEFPLTVTHRCAPEVVSAFRPLNKTLTSSRPAGQGYARNATTEDAFGRWLEARGTALWVTRTNKEAARVFLRTLKAKRPCSFRADTGQIEAVFYRVVGRGTMPIQSFRARLAELIRDKSESRKADMIESFILELALEAESVSGLKKLLLENADAAARHCVANVYRVKGDEADEVFVSDAEHFGQAWNNDPAEMRSVLLVAMSRARDGLTLVDFPTNFVLGHCFPTGPAVA